MISARAADAGVDAGALPGRWFPDIVRLTVPAAAPS
jgi:hypothetical protein